MITEWIKIKRDKAGFATELDEMFKNELIIVARSEYNRFYYNVIELENQADWRGEIDRDICYTHYLPIKEII